MDNNSASDIVPIVLLSLLSIAHTVVLFFLWKRVHDANLTIGSLTQRVSALEQDYSFVLRPNIDVAPSSVLNTSELVGIRVQSDAPVISSAALNSMRSFGNTDVSSL